MTIDRSEPVEVTLTEDERRLATEIVFASNVVGSGLDWPSTTGVPDGQAIVLLRAVQRKLSGRLGEPEGTRHAGGPPGR